VFVVGYLGDWRRAAAVLFERDSLHGHPAPCRETGEGVAPTISASALKAAAGLGTDFDCDGGLIANTLSAARGVACANAADLETYIPVVSPALKSRDYKGPSSDGDGEGSPLIAHSFRAEGFDASEDGTGRGTPLVPMAFNWQSGGDARGLDPKPVTSALSRQQTPAIAFTAKDHGADAGAISPTLRGGGHHHSHANGGVMPAVAFESRFARNGRGAPSEIVPPLKAQSGDTGKGDAAPLLATTSAVRRLTPRECERLQGFPDDYTLVPYRGKPAADGPRYKALGNSMAVPVMRWIGTRIGMVDALPQQKIGD
jgi:DNA (cytosine-5)-methyltransferase 1